MTIFVLGIDLGKNVCSLVGLDEAGAVVLRRCLRREGVAAFVGKLPACIVAMEACCGAHYLGRVLGAAGHTIRLMSPEYVRPYVARSFGRGRDLAAWLGLTRRGRQLPEASRDCWLEPQLSASGAKKTDSRTAAWTWTQ